MMAAVAKVAYAVVGRAADCEIVVPGPSVSNRHARLRWQRGELLIEDLGSANGTYLDGEKVTRSTVVRIGQDVRLGVEVLPWDDDKLRAFLRHGASDTIVAQPRFGRYRCPKCKKVALVPMGFKHGELSCTHCGAGMLIGTRTRTRSLVGTIVTLGLAGLVTLVVGGALLGVDVGGRALLGLRPKSADASGKERSVIEPFLPETLQIAASRTASDMSEEERSIRDSGTARRVMEAMDASHPVTRNLAVQVAAAAQGPYHVEQVAAIWLKVRAGFHYVNDPRGSEYFARASETIGNGFAGDCDDFAATLAGMVIAIGGRARVVVMDGARGGHAYAEACVDAVPSVVAKRLRSYVRRRWDRRLGSVPALTHVYFRSDEGCPVWLNLDWNANVPAGPYEDERWAVSIESDGATETLSPADAPPKPTAKTRGRAVARPDTQSQ